MKTENKQNKALNKTDVNHSVLTLEHLAPYLPYGLNYFVDGEEKSIKMNGLYDFDDVYTSDFGDTPIILTRPILRPITDVFKKIEVNGETFRPSVKLNFHLAFKSDKEFYEDIKNEIISVKLQRQLIKWHFDVFGLIEKGLAVSIHDVE